MTDLYIIAAGKGSRMGGGVPKALIPIEDGIPNITNTIKQAEGFFERIFIIYNKDVSTVWKDYIQQVTSQFPNINTIFLEISSGLGDGHAVLNGLKKAKHTYPTSKNAVICWGDAFIQHSETFKEILNASNSIYPCTGWVPAVLEPAPYVALLVDTKMNCISADFSKYGENHPSGFHDQSVFCFNRDILLDALHNLHNCFWKNGRYITPGGELSMLYVFHYLYNIDSAVSVYQTDYPTMGFNTPSEVADIQREIRKTW